MRAQECADAIERETHQQAHVASSLSEATKCLGQAECQAIVIDESWQQVEGDVDRLVYDQEGTALPIYVNLSLHAAERVAHEVSCGLQRLDREQAASMRVATSNLRSELRGEVTAILLNTDLALREPSLTPNASEKLRAVQETAEKMCSKLDGVPIVPEPRNAKVQPVRRKVAHGRN